MPHVIPLPTRLDVDAACDLWNQLSGAEDDLHLDAAAVTHLPAAGLQVLLMARLHLQSRGRSLVLVGPGADCRARLAQMGAAALLPVIPLAGDPA